MVTDLLKTETEDIHRELEQLEFAQALPEFSRSPRCIGRSS